MPWEPGPSRAPPAACVTGRGFMNKTSSISPTEVLLAGQTGFIHDLPKLLGADFWAMPVVHRLLLENVLRCMEGEERDAAVAALVAWLKTGTSESEIEFQPGRVLMHDTTSTPALVDIAAMRDDLAESG